MRVALITGASRGIGQAIAIRLAATGVHCVLSGRSQGGLEETDDRIRAAAGEATLLPLDMADAAGIDAVGPSLAARFGRLDILVHAAASLGVLTPVAHFAEADWRPALAVNTEAAWRLIRTTSPMLRAAHAGRAVFLTDARAHAPGAFWGMLAAGKAAMEALVLSWADEVSSDGRLRVNLFDPGIVATRLRAQAMPGEDPAPLRRPEQVAPEVVALCSPEDMRHGLRVVG